MRLTKYMVAWTPANEQFGQHAKTRGRVQVGTWPDFTGWSDDYSHTAGAGDCARHTLPEATQLTLLFVDFHTLVVRDGIDPQAAHEAFLAVDEYRARINPDIAGAG